MSIVQLNFWLMPNGDFDTLSAIEKEITHFEKWHTNIHIEPTIIPWSHAWDRLMNVHKQQGELVAPDVIQIGTTWVSTLNYLGVLRDISAFFDEDITSDIIIPLKESSISYETGGFMAMPWMADIRMLYYRIDILRLYGFSSRDLEDFDSFRNVCLVIQSKRKSPDDIMAFRLSGHSEVVLIHDLAPWIWGMGGHLLSANLKKVSFDSPQARKAIHWYFDLVNDLYGGKDSHKRYGIIPTGSFFSGNFATEIIGKSPLYNLSNLKHSNYSQEVAKNYGVVNLPKGPEGSFPFIGGSSLAVPKWSRYPEEAAEWIRFLVSSESQMRHGYRIGVFPSRISLLQNYFKDYKEDYEVIATTLKNGRSLPYSPLLGTLERILSAFSDHVLMAIRSGEYTSDFLDREINQAAMEANYIFSMYM
ncbi:MAG: extracellular solute-binding protein [Candidatus Aureabacteria bacterium]|nr:extracellular solute-binding protein [Candidatus Auribacterota bacterium]